jgi:GT2 family glycosyltransferase
MDLSFVILTWNSRRYVERCIASIRDAIGSAVFSYEVLILDNGSTDGTVELLKHISAGDPAHILCTYELTNLGTTRSRNILLKKARGSFVCIMDSDVELARGVLERLLGVLRSDATLGIVVPRIVYPSGKWQKSFDRLPTVIDKAHRLLRLRQIEARQSQDFQHATAPLEVDYAISAFWLMPRALLGVVGLLDERIFYAPEDTDFCLRVWRTGHRILYVPDVTVVHHTQEISRGFKLNRAKLSHVKGLLYYFLKHRYWLRRPRLRPNA